MTDDFDDVPTSIQAIPALLGQARPKSAYLLVLSSGSTTLTGRMFKLVESESVLGRSPEAQILIVDDGVSRTHAKLVKRGSGEFTLVDLGSRNGTFVNEQRLTGPHVLRDGDKIQIGSTTVLLFSLQDEVEEQFQKSMFEAATRDGLTRVYNKKYFLDALRKEWAFCQRHQSVMSLVMIDVDHFKKVNDTYGHPAGDFVLTRAAQRVSEMLRTEDLIARYGGEEFVMILRGTRLPEAVICAERCRRAIESCEFVFEGTRIRVTISLGVAALDLQHHASPEQLIAEADRFLYKAKQDGRNRVAYE